jgi:lipopolysaccharide export system protein LptC
MLNARYEGLDDKDQPYLLSADQAIQSSDNKDLIDLEMPKGDISLDDGAWLAMDANEGVYNRETELLDLAGNVTLFHDNGFELRSESARIDLEAGTAEGHETTEGQGPSGSSLSEGFLVLERGDVLVFTGKSRVVIRPNEKQDDEASVAPAEAAPAEAAPAGAAPTSTAP